jgi:predicted Zn-dependent protease
VAHEPKLDAYVAQLGGALAKYAASSFTYTFTLYDDRQPVADPRKADLTTRAADGAAMPMDAFQGQAEEPVAVAGGPIFIPMSLLAAAPNESVFAFQLAHAIAHAALRHATRQATLTDRLGLDALRAQNTAVADRGATENSPGTVPLGMLQFSAAFERQADYAATLIVSQAGYSPEWMADYLSGLPARGKGGARFSGHPPPSERSKAIRAQFRRLPAATYAAATGGFVEAREMVWVRALFWCTLELYEKCDAKCE